MDTKHEEMTAAEHVERARAQGQTVAEYCRQTGLSVHALYSARRQMKENGRAPGAPPRRSARKTTGKFITVRVTEAASTVVCRVRHPAGWVIECGSWPDPRWMKELTGEQT
jgi:transposase-like protein